MRPVTTEPLPRFRPSVAGASPVAVAPGGDARAAGPAGAPCSPARRRWLALSSRCGLGLVAAHAAHAAGAAAAGAGAGPATGLGGAAAFHAAAAAGDVLTVHTFGDSVLDCGHYNAHGVHPGGLLVRNDDRLFPEFAGHDLASRGPAALVHRAVDGATVAGLPAQARGLPRPPGPAVALVTVGGNDLLRGLAADAGPGVRAFEAAFDAFLRSLPVRPVLLGTVYDPTFGDDARNFLDVPARVARANHRRVNDAIGALAERHGGRLVDLHAHFLRGNDAWFTNVIEPSLVGASEVRRAFLAAL